MAQYDTGQGWSAKEEWLFASTGEIATVGGMGFPGYSDQPIPKNCINYPGTIAGGFVGFTYARNTGYSTFYYGARDNVDVLMCLVTDPGGTSYTPYAISLDQQYTVFAVDVRSTGREYDNEYTPNGSTIVDNVTFYHRNMPSMTISGFLTINLPIFSSITDACSAIRLAGIAYNKLNPGFAVTCGAEWISPGGVTLRSPILISPDSSAVVMTTDGTTPAANMEVFDFLKDGMRFYMSIIAGNTDPVTTNFEYADLTQFMAAMPSKVFSLLASETYANIQIVDSPDPYGNETDPSEEEGGDGEDQEDDPVEEETLPVPSVAGHGFCTIYVPSSQELGQMASYLWSGSFDVDQVIKLFSNPMDSILGLSAVPVSLSGTPEQIYLGGVALTGITMPKYTGRTSVKVDFGTATIEERWGSYLDYEPYTEFSIYLPFIGIKPLKADDIMGKTVSLMYNIDILSGGCVAYLRPAGSSVLYEWSGQCALQIPVTARNYDNVFQTAMSVVGAVGAAVVAPASAPVLSGAVASAAVQAAATKPRIERSGTVNGITGFLGQLRPYIIRTIPEAFIPADQNKFIGYPAYINVDLASVTGYNEVDSIHLENVTATGAELDEIETILKGGVIF